LLVHRAVGGKEARAREATTGSDVEIEGLALVLGEVWAARERGDVEHVVEEEVHEAIADQRVVGGHRGEPRTHSLSHVTTRRAPR